METKYEKHTALKDLAPAKKGDAARLAELTDAELAYAAGGLWPHACTCSVPDGYDDFDW